MRAHNQTKNLTRRGEQAGRMNLSSCLLPSAEGKGGRSRRGSTERMRLLLSKTSAAGARRRSCRCLSEGCARSRCTAAKSRCRRAECRRSAAEYRRGSTKCRCRRCWLLLLPKRRARLRRNAGQPRKTTSRLRLNIIFGIAADGVPGRMQSSQSLLPVPLRSIRQIHPPPAETSQVGAHFERSTRRRLHTCPKPPLPRPPDPKPAPGAACAPPVSIPLSAAGADACRNHTRSVGI